MGTGGWARDDLRRLSHGDALPLKALTPTVDSVWYAAYGSNLCAARFRCYLEGGTPPGASGACRGARDATPPRRERALQIPYRLYFAETSRLWGGAPSFIDPVGSPEASARARAYLITWEQFEDLVAQENGRPSWRIDMGVGRDDLAAGFSCRIGTGRYENLLCVGRLDGQPVLTFTSSRSLAEARAELAPPSSAYLAMMVDGLREAHGMSDGALTAYLGAAPGCSEDLVSSVLTAILTPTPSPFAADGSSRLP